MPGSIRNEGDLFAQSVCDMVEMALFNWIEEKTELLFLAWDRVIL